MVGETTNIQGPLIRRMKPDVVIIQVQMPFDKTKEALDWICAVESPPKVAIVTMLEVPARIRTFLRLGVSGCVLKSALSRQLVGEVRPAVFVYVTTAAYRCLAEPDLRPGGQPDARPKGAALPAARLISS